MTGDASTRTLILWDIDGTLLGADDVDHEAFDRAVERVVGRRPTGAVVMAGKTDPQIAREYLAMLGTAGSEDRVSAILAHLEAEMAAALAREARADRVLPGAAELLARLHADHRVFQTVVTGNIAANARIKLATFGLDRWLDLAAGAFGSDRADRNELVPVARGRVARLRGLHFADQAVWVVGDSVPDLACARAAGVRCLLVATGRLDRGQLDGLGADAVRDDLSDVDAVVDLLTGDHWPR